MTVQLIEIGPKQVASVQQQLGTIYSAAFSSPLYREIDTDVVRFGDHIQRHCRLEGFRCIAAREQDGALVGFGYGYRSKPGQWWRDVVAGRLGETSVVNWLGDSFELVELAVLPSKQGQGIGGRIHDAVLSGVRQRTAVLSTLQGDTNALKLYRNRGWQTLLWDFFFPGTDYPLLVMGLDLTLGLQPSR